MARGGGDQKEDKKNKCQKSRGGASPKKVTWRAFETARRACVPRMNNSEPPGGYTSVLEGGGGKKRDLKTHRAA